MLHLMFLAVHVSPEATGNGRGITLLRHSPELPILFHLSFSHIFTIANMVTGMASDNPMEMIILITYG